MLFRPQPPRADLTLWVSADLHARMYQDSFGGPSLLENFQYQNCKTVRLNLIATPAMDVRLLSLFMFSQGRSSGTEPSKTDAASPDVVEISLGSIGKYFRPPADEIGFLPLNNFLATRGWRNRIIESRFSPWSKDGKIFGIPHDLHPCTLTYRKDLFDQAGISLESVTTWPQLQQRCLAFQKYWFDHGRARTAMGLSSTSPDMLLVLLHQQHVELVGPDLSPHLADPAVAPTLCWYARAVAGSNKIATDLNPAAGQSAADLASGDICSLITPDWLVADLKQYGPNLAGKLHMIPLPRFSPQDAPTASWGGTMIGITRTCPHPDLAWKLIETLYLNPSAMKIRQQASGILPPIPEYWSDPVYHQPDPFFAGQKINELYIQLASQLPDARMTPYNGQVQILLAFALNRAVARVRSGDVINLEADCRQWLSEAQAQLVEIIRFDSDGR